MSEETASVERLDPVELAFQGKVLDALVRAQAGLAVWQAFLTEKYRLRPGDGVMDDGSIVRPSQSDTASA